MIINLKNPGTEEYFKLKNNVNSGMMEWYWVPSTTSVDDEGTPIQQDFDDMPYYGHQIMGRPLPIRPPYKAKPTKKPYSIINSPHFFETYKVLEQIFTHNKMEVSVIYRINFNSTTFSEVKKSPYHIDLEFPHKNLIIYMSKFSKGWTYVTDGTKEVKSTPKEDGIIMFDGNLAHCQSPPKINERRVVLVLCFL